MTEATKSKSKWTPVLVFLMTAPAIAFLAAVPILKDQSDGLVYLLGGAASITVMTAAIMLAVLKDRRADEWTRTNARFASYWGYVAGGAFIVVLLSIPAVRDFIAALGQGLSSGPVDDKVVLMSFTAGFMACVMAQMIFILIFSAIWRLWMSRAI